MRSLALSLLIIFYPALALADECAEPLAVTTPCDGVLLPPKAAEDALKCLRVDVPRLKLDIKYAESAHSSFKKYHDQLLLAERNRSGALEEQVEFLLKSNVAPKWYESPTFHFALGFITASAVTIGITYAVNSN